MPTSLFPFRSPKLPPEICDAIISSVDEYAYSSLAGPYRTGTTRKGLHSCALVCHSWTTRARIHLFRVVTIDNRSASNFAAVVTTHPQVGSYVKRVELSGDYRSKDSESSMSTTPVHNGWIYDFLNKVVPHLPNLTSTEFQGLPILHRYFYICHPPRALSLTSLSLSSFNATSAGDVLRLINSYKNLKELYINRGEWGEFRNHHYHVGRRWSCHLRVLSIQRSTVGDILDLFYWFAQLKTSSFEHLFLQWGFSPRKLVDTEQAPTRPFPKSPALGWARTLKTLSLDFLDNGNSPGPYKAAVVSKLLPIIKTCANLHTIRLLTTSDQYEILQQLPDVLPALPSLRRIGLYIDRLEQVLQEERRELWGAVDRVFADSKKLSTVEYFEVMWTMVAPLEEKKEGGRRVPTGMERAGRIA
ncbi:hypothetical protein NLI96_g11741 [Meripilus lineatus]|uniref:F-box domain-containing protein n=1 Tax=Meripilus lineatus TaxID=2056292 RepID=A0AAD5UVB1_9APHY|nr:hypothetical protein NLI96_g11741 [Physisporinus lineatus]